MPTMEEIMLTFIGRDQLSKVAKSIDGNIKSMANNAMNAVNNMSAGFMNISSSFDSMLTGLTGKTASDMIFGTSSKAETNKVLLKNMTETAASAEALYKTVDEVTNKSLTSMQELIPAMNAFKAATGASDQELTNVTDDIANFGAAVLAQTGSTELAQTAMMDLSKGIKGAFASLDQYGVSEDALMRTGLWSGKEEDVEGYMAAVTEVIGSTEELMQTNEGLDAQIGKAFSRAGKKIGNEFLPFIKDIKKGFLDLDSAVGGNLAAGILATAQGVEFLNQGLFQVTTMANGIRDLQAAWGGVKDVIKGVVAQMGKAKAMQVAAETLPDVTPQQIGAAEAMSGFQIEPQTTRKVSKNEYLQDMLDYQVASVDEDKTKMALLEKKYEDLDLEANKLNTKSTKTFDNLDKTVTNTSKTKKIGSKAGAASSGMKSTSVSLRGLGSGALSMVAPLIEIGIAIAIIMPIIAGLAAEALLLIKGLGELVKALDFKSLKLDEQIDGIKQVGEALWEVARTMGAMSLAGAATLVYSFISAFSLFTNPIQTAVTEIKKVIPIVNQLGTVQPVSDSVVPNLQKVTQSMKAVSEAIGSMADTTWDVMMGNLMTLGGLFGNFSTNINAAKTDIINASKALNEMGDLQAIDPQVATNLKAVSESMESVAEAIKSMSSVDWEVSFKGGNPFKQLVPAIKAAKNDIVAAAPVINSFKDMPNVDQETANKIKAVSDAMSSVASAIKNMSSVDWEVNFKGGNPFKNLTASLRSAKKDIWNAAKELQAMKDMPAVPDNIKSKLNQVGSATATVINTMKPLSQLAGQDIDSGEITSKVQQARYAISNAATHLASLSGIAQVPENLSEILNRVGTAAATAINTMKPLTQLAGLDVNSAEIASKVAQVRYAISNTATHLGSLGGIATIPENLGETLNRVGTTVTQVSKVATKLNSLPVVTATTGNIALAVTAVKTTVTELNQLAGTSLNGGVSTLLTNVTNALNQLKATLAAMSGGFTASGILIGSSIVAGVQTGLSPLPSVVISSVSSATASAASTGWTGGSRIGTSVTNGFKSALKLASAMKTEMGYVKQAIDNGINAAKSAAESGAKEVVEAFKRGIETGSPGAMAWAMFDEMGYIRDFIVSEGKQVVSSARRLGQNIVDGFGSPALTIDPLSKLNGVNGSLTTEHIGSMETMMSRAPPAADNRPVSIYIYEGAVQLDARNLTTRESKQVLINALEGLDVVSSINLKRSV